MWRKTAATITWAAHRWIDRSMNPKFRSVMMNAIWLYAIVMTDMNFGFMLRSIHRWSAQVMVAAVFLHMLRVYFTGAYKEPRELNWLIGIVLISLTLLFGYTGYLLPWDQLAFWAGQIGVQMALSVPIIGEWVAQLMWGGFSLGQPTLQRMYIIHVFFLPFVVTTLIAVHIGIVWIQGIAEPH